MTIPYDLEISHDLMRDGFMVSLKMFVPTYDLMGSDFMGDNTNLVTAHDVLVAKLHLYMQMEQMHQLYIDTSDEGSVTSYETLCENIATAIKDLLAVKLQLKAREEDNADNADDDTDAA